MADTNDLWENGLENSTGVVLLTGATGGIGRETALLLARHGTRLVLSGRDARALETLANEINYAAGTDCAVFAADLTDPQQVTNLVTFAEAQEGGIYAIVNACGTGVIKPIDATVPNEMQAVLQANLFAAMLLSQAAVRVMATRKKGRIIHVVGILGKAPLANASAYCASKYGLSGFLAALRAEVARKLNLHIIGLYLGGVDTPFWENPAIEMKVQKDKMLTVADAARTILFALTQPGHLVMSEIVLQPESHQM